MAASDQAKMMSFYLLISKRSKFLYNHINRVYCTEVTEHSNETFYSV